MILGMDSIAQARNAARVHVGITFEPHKRFATQRFPVAVRPQDAPDPWTKESRFLGGRGRPVVPAQRNAAYTYDPLPWSYWEMDRFRGTFYKVYFNAVTKSQQVVSREGYGARGPSWGERVNLVDPASTTYGDSVGETGRDYYDDDDSYFPGGF